MDLFFDLLRSVIYGVIEGITEWLPISSTGHMILAEQVLKFSFSAEFMEMFRVVIQLGAILAVVVMYFKKLWPFCVDNGRDSGLAKHIRWPVMRLWFKIIVACLPAAVLGLALDDWIDAHFYNSVVVAVMLIVFVIGWAYLRYSAGGRSLYAIGGNPEVARLAGINVNLYTIGVYVVSGFLAGLAGIVLAMRLDSVQPTAGVTYELDTIAAVVIGGTSLTGGKGGIFGTIIGVLIIGVLRNGLNLLGVSPFMQAVVIGVVIALAVAAEAFKQNK